MDVNLGSVPYYSYMTLGVVLNLCGSQFLDL